MQQAEEDGDGRRREEAGDGEGAVLGEGDWGAGEERDVHSAVLPRAHVEGEPVLLVAAEVEGATRGEGIGEWDAKQSGKLAGQATFALVSEDGGELGSARIELVLRDGRRLRIGKGVDEETLRTVVGVLEEGC